MKVTLIVHGVVQGVGYRNLVRNAAVKHGIRGFVRNVHDGSVEIVAIGSEEDMRNFERDIVVGEKYGPQVMHLERTEREADGSELDGFRIMHDKKL